MGTKTNPGAFDCYAAAKDDEPMFILLGRDKDAAVIVRIWALFREMQIDAGAKPESDMTQVHEARQCAYEMERYRSRLETLISNVEYMAREDVGTVPAGGRGGDPNTITWQEKSRADQAARRAKETGGNVS